MITIKNTTVRSEMVKSSVRMSFTANKIILIFLGCVEIAKTNERDRMYTRKSDPQYL
jgi:hypothetical protein